MSNFTDMDLPMSTGYIPPMLGAGNLSESGALARTYSPVTLNHDWSKIARLLVMLFCSTFGSTMNGYAVASFFVDESLRRKGNVFLACTGLADLLITVGVTPVSAVLILSGQWDSIEVCKALQFIATTSVYCYNINFAFVAIENFYRHCRPTAEYAYFLSMRIDFICVIIFIISVVLSAVGVYMDLDYDYCERLHYGDFKFRLYTTIFAQLLPAFIASLLLFICTIKVNQLSRTRKKYKRGRLYRREFTTTFINLTAYLLFLAAWSPYLTVLYRFPNISDSIYYNFMSIGLLRSSVTSTMFGLFNKNFRRAYAHIFNYCFCKNSLSGSISNRNRNRMIEYKSTIGEVRVHILHQAVAPAKRQRGVSCFRETRAL